jgi:aldose 1-epimerase
VLPKLSAWELRETGADGKGAWLRASLDFSPQTPAFEVFPFPHSLPYTARLAVDLLRIEVRLRPTGEQSVPISFGFHPYLRLGGSRPEAIVWLPALRRLLLDRRMIPTGRSEAFRPGRRRLGARGWDDAFTELETPPRFALSRDTRTLSLTFGDGYRFAQVFSPPEADYVCFEPMTAPTNALLSGPPGLSLVRRSQDYQAAFEISMSPVRAA